MNSPRTIRARSGAIVLLVVIFLATLMALFGFVLDDSSRTTLGLVYKARRGQELLVVAREHLLGALLEFRDRFQALQPDSPRNALQAQIMGLRPGQSMELTMPVTPFVPLDGPVPRASDVRLTLRLIQGDLATAFTRKRLAFHVAATKALPAAPGSRTQQAPRACKTIEYDCGVPGCHLPPLLPGIPTGSSGPTSPASGAAPAASPAPATPGSQGGTTSPGPHESVIGVAELTVEVSTGVKAGRYAIDRTYHETKIVLFRAHHVPWRIDNVWWDVPTELSMDVSPFYVARRILEGGEAR